MKPNRNMQMVCAFVVCIYRSLVCFLMTKLHYCIHVSYVFVISFVLDCLFG